MPTTHDLKIWTTFFDMLQSGTKTFELRRNDRNYQVGDVLHLREWRVSEEVFTGRECMRTVSYILAGGQFGIEEGYVAMGFAPQPAAHRNQYDELLHCLTWIKAEGREPSVASLEAYCTAHSLPMP